MMSSFPILDLVIGLIFIYFLLSLITSSGVEIVLTAGKIRSKILAQWLRDVFNLPSLHPDGTGNNAVTLGQAIMDHCAVTALSQPNTSTNYMKAETFVTALLDQITRIPAGTPNAPAPDPNANPPFQPPPKNLGEYITAITSTSVIAGELKRTFIGFANEANLAASAQPGKSAIDLFREKLEGWFDSNSDRLTGKLKKRYAFPITILIAAIVTIGINADTILISRYLYDHKEVSSKLVDKALDSYQSYHARIDSLKSAPTDTTTKTSIAEVKQLTVQLKGDIDSLHAALPPDFPIGWNRGKEKASVVKANAHQLSNPVWKGKTWENLRSKLIRYCYYIWAITLKHIIGWLATIGAVMLGAPFWFDILNKIANLRGAGPKPETSAESKKQ